MINTSVTFNYCWTKGYNYFLEIKEISSFAQGRCLKVLSPLDLFKQVDLTRKSIYHCRKFDCSRIVVGKLTGPSRSFAGTLNTSNLSELCLRLIYDGGGG